MPMTLLQAIADDNLFAPWFARTPETWVTWRAFIKALFGGSGIMTRDELAIYRDCTGRTSPPRTQAEEAWLICGRRSGKSFVLSLIATYLATFIDWRPYLAIGEVATIPVIAKDQRQARTIIRYISSFFDEVPMLARMVVGRTRSSFTLDNRVIIEVHSASFK